MKTFYVSGPYSKGDVVQNVQRAIAVAEILTSRGYLVFVPHLTHLWHMICPHEYEFWMKMDLAWLEKCDCLFRMDGESAGADREVKYARELDIPVLFNLEDVPVWLPADPIEIDELNRAA